MIDPIQILREKHAAMIGSRLRVQQIQMDDMADVEIRHAARKDAQRAYSEFSDAVAFYLPEILALPYHLPASALIAVEGFAASDQLPIAAAYPTEDGEWRAVRGTFTRLVYRDDETATVPDCDAAIAKLREWGCVRIVRQFRDELPVTETGGAS